jgi:actin-related protein
VDQGHYHLIRDIKERMCHVAGRYASEMERRDDDLSIEDRSYELPGGEIIEVKLQKRITAAEVMFEPTLVGARHDEFGECSGGIAELAYRSIEKCDSDLKI